MGLRRDMIRTIERRQKYWERVRREQALQSEQPTDHAKEYSRVVAGEQAHYEHLAKINQLRRQSSSQ
ncbi:hypothetical protein [Sneathiella glossodoripedis]|uniref:hypothetical protein n=1 Tax=Sneathiella glossodoripedis TaxID=418853 RepID=UPI0004707A21|nr:hypothetical protein [Sneathiella glossodoripedis]